MRKRIAEAVEPFSPYWLEDPVRMDSLDALATFADKTRVPVCASETVGSRWDQRALLDTGAPAARDLHARLKARGREA